MMMKKCFGYVIISGFLFFCSLGYSCRTNWAEECAGRFPTKTDTVTQQIITLKTDTFIVENPVHVTETVQTVCPPSTDTVIITKQITVDCPESKTIIRTVTVHDSIIIHAQNTAKEKDLAQQIEVLKTENTRTKTGRNIYGWSALILFGLLATIVFLKRKGIV